MLCAFNSGRLPHPFSILTFINIEIFLFRVFRNYKGFVKILFEPFTISGRKT
jgi:hypothetical protein